MLFVPLHCQESCALSTQLLWLNARIARMLAIIWLWTARHARVNLARMASVSVQKPKQGKRGKKQKRKSSGRVPHTNTDTEGQASQPDAGTEVHFDHAEDLEEFLNTAIASSKVRHTHARARPFPLVCVMAGAVTGRIIPAPLVSLTSFLRPTLKMHMCLRVCVRGGRTI